MPSQEDEMQGRSCDFPFQSYLHKLCFLSNHEMLGCYWNCQTDTNVPPRIFQGLRTHCRWPPDCPCFPCRRVIQLIIELPFFEEPRCVQNIHDRPYTAHVKEMCNWAIWRKDTTTSEDDLSWARQAGTLQRWGKSTLFSPARSVAATNCVDLTAITSAIDVLCKAQKDRPEQKQRHLGAQILN